jgi:hypothetical protein
VKYKKDKLPFAPMAPMKKKGFTADYADLR